MRNCMYFYKQRFSPAKLVAVLLAGMLLLVGGLGVADDALSEELVADHMPLTQQERAYLYENMPDTSENAVPVEELKSLVDRAMAESDEDKYGEIKKEMIKEGLTTDPEMLESGSRWLYGVQVEKDGYPLSIHNLKEGPDYGRLDVYEDRIKKFIQTGVGMEALYNLRGKARILLPSLEDGSEDSKKFLEQIRRGIKLLQDNAPVGVDVVEWLWNLGLNEYYICKYDESLGSEHASVAGYYGRIFSNFGEVDADAKSLYRMIVYHLVIESYSIAYQRLGVATLYGSSWSIDNRMSETVKYLVANEVFSCLIDSVSDSEKDAMGFLAKSALSLAKASGSYWDGLESQRSMDWLMLMFPPMGQSEKY